MCAPEDQSAAQKLRLKRKETRQALLSSATIDESLCLRKKGGFVGDIPACILPWCSSSWILPPKAVVPMSCWKQVQTILSRCWMNSSGNRKNVRLSQNRIASPSRGGNVQLPQVCAPSLAFPTPLLRTPWDVKRILSFNVYSGGGGHLCATRSLPLVPLSVCA